MSPRAVGPADDSGHEDGFRLTDAERRSIRPRPLNETVRKQMSRMPTKDTESELALRRELHKRGLRFRLHLRSLPGRPDIAFTRAHVAVFVDGCFWHRCTIHGTAPRNNGAWWAEKLDANVARDQRNDRSLRDLGWLPVHVWEHDDPSLAAARIHALWRSRLADGSAGELGDVGGL
jgi:DNA mismatch endonuclease (patch repair protein)